MDKKYISTQKENELLKSFYPQIILDYSSFSNNINRRYIIEQCSKKVESLERIIKKQPAKRIIAYN